MFFSGKLHDFHTKYTNYNVYRRDRQAVSIWNPVRALFPHSPSLFRQPGEQENERKPDFFSFSVQNNAKRNEQMIKVLKNIG